MAGSSAIIVAALRCLMDFYQIDIPKVVQPSLALSVEVEELGIGAGLQDRVIQVYEGVVYMDFAPEHMQETNGYLHGQYEPLDPNLLPPIYLAYNTDSSEPTEVFHNDIRGRFHRGDNTVIRNAYIGPYTSIGSNTLIENAEVDNSIIMDDVTIKDVDRRLDRCFIAHKANVTGSKRSVQRLILSEYAQVEI